jgi:chemotaxis protein methyltransferase CheR
MDFVEAGLAPPLPLAVARTVASAACEVRGPGDGGRLRNVAFRGIPTGRVEKRPPAGASRALPPLPTAHEASDGRAADFLQWVLVRAGLDPAVYRIAPLLRRLPACLRALRVDSVRAARDVLEQRPLLVPKALEALLIGTTEWFRDAVVFEQLEQQVLPEILGRTKCPRIWSAASSEGLELLSVAMLLAARGHLHSSLLLGSDCRVEAIDRAKRGIFERRTFPPAWQGYFHPVDERRVEVAPELRRFLRWELANILAADHSRSWDLIMCRNLAIYLEPQAAENLWERLAAQLVPGGFLMVGKAEKPRLPYLRRISHSIYQKCPDPTPR